MTSYEMWILLNKDRYTCECCNYSSYNKSLFVRHLNSTKHWLNDFFFKNCPNDLKVVVGSFLPMQKLIKSGKNGLRAMNLQARSLSIGMLINLLPPNAGLHVQIYEKKGQIIRMQRNPVFSL